MLFKRFLCFNLSLRRSLTDCFANFSVTSFFILSSHLCLQAPWDGTDHSSPAHHMFNESDPILGPSTLEAGFLEEEDEEAQGADRGAEEGGTLEECLGLPPSSSPSHPSAGDSVEPLSSSYMLFKVGFCILCRQGNINDCKVNGYHFKIIEKTVCSSVAQWLIASQ